MGTTLASVLDQRLSQLIGDWIEESVTTTLTTNTSVISTNLNKWDDGQGDFFNSWWVYITNLANIAEDRKIYDYTSSDGACSIRGANLLSDSTSTSMAVCRFYRHSYTSKIRAINDAIRELSNVLFREVDDRTLVTGNILPDGSFEWWTATTTPKFYTKSTDATLAQIVWSSTNDDYIRGAIGTTSMQVTAGAGKDDQYAYIDSISYPRLLDCKGKTITFRCWVRPSADDDGFLTIVYEDEDGTATTTNSTTECPIDVFTLIEIEDLAIPSDTTKITFRFRVHSGGENAYFDNARVTGKTVHEYMLPDSFQDGNVAQVYIQSSSYSDEPCDDIMPETWDRVFNFDITSDGTYKFLHLPYTYGSNRQIRLKGTSPLSTLSSFAGTTEIDGSQVDLLTTYAAYCLFRNEEGVPSSEDTSGYRSRAMKWLGEYLRLKPSLRMIAPHGTLKLPSI